MQFWKPPATSEHTRLAKKPALDKCKPDTEWKKELGPNTYQASASVRLRDRIAAEPSVRT